ncbi:hypothetical protein AB0B28_08205 [Glycomyces sp. NPDC046736]|uniref:hypothetical protein n=1 Tax=Glycomyces sp. NPDC046736 TaxID=3155615 RepID=UPI0033DA31CB
MPKPRTALNCTLCGKPTAGDTGALCGTCTTGGVRTLWSLAVWAPQLATTVTRRDRINHPDTSGPAGHRPDEQPLPVNLHAANLHAAVRRLLNNWTARLHTHRPHTLAPRHRPACDTAQTWCAHPSCRTLYLDPATAAPTLAEQALELAGASRWWRHEPDAADLLHTTRRLLDHIRDAVDIPPAMVTLGRCDYTYDDHGDRCNAELRAPKGHPFTTCPLCGAVYDVERRRTQLLDRIEGHILPAPVVVGIITAWMGIDIPLSTLRTWKDRDQLESYGIDRETRANRYRIGDVRRCVLRDLNDAAKQAATERNTGQNDQDHGPEVDKVLAA